MNELMLFNNEEFGEIRSLLIDNELNGYNDYENNLDNLK